MTGPLQTHDKTLTPEELLLMDEQRKQVLEMEFLPVKVLRTALK